MVSKYQEIEQTINFYKIQLQYQYDIFDEEYQKYETINSTHANTRDEFYNVQDQINEIEYNLKSMEDEIEDLQAKIEYYKEVLYDLYTDGDGNYIFINGE